MGDGPRGPGPSTRSVHLGREVDPADRTVVPPLVDNAAFGFPDLDTWRAVALKQQPGHIYSRNSNPTLERFEAKVAALEGAEAGLGFATGMAAISTTLLALIDSTSRAVTVRDVYGGTYLLFTELLPSRGLACDVCDTDDLEAFERVIRAGASLVYLESPTNPTLKVLDLARWIRAAHDAGALAVVDNTFATPINQRPVELGADLVLHSATKFLGGHGDVLGGVVCGRRAVIERIYRWRELIGTTLDARSAHVLLRSLKTLGLRIERQNSSALQVASHLARRPEVAWVHYPGLPSHEGHAIACRQMSGFGGVLSFELHGGLDAVARVLPHLRYACLAANLGQVETVAGPPSLTSHVELSPAERAAAGIPEGLVRYAVGIEDPSDLTADLDAALARL